MTALLLSLTVRFHSLSPALPQAELCMDYSRLERRYKLNHRLEPTASVARPKNKKNKNPADSASFLAILFIVSGGFSVPTSSQKRSEHKQSGTESVKKVGQNI